MLDGQALLLAHEALVRGALEIARALFVALARLRARGSAPCR